MPVMFSDRSSCISFLLVSHAVFSASCFCIFLFSLPFRGVNKETRGTAFVVYEDIYDAKNAVDHLSGFNVANRYLIVLYYQQAKFTKKIDQVSAFLVPPICLADLCIVFNGSVLSPTLVAQHIRWCL